MLMKDFFEAVDRAFIQGAGRNPAPRRPELKTLAGLPLSALESSSATSSSEWPSSARSLSSARSSLQRQVQQPHKDATTDKAHESRGKISQAVQDAREGQREDRQIQGASFSLMLWGFSNPSGQPPEGSSHL